MKGVLRKYRKALPVYCLLLGLMLVALFTCKVPPGSDPPPPGGVRINITGYPASFFNSRTCNYAICESDGDPKTPAERVAEGAISLSSGSGISAVENLEAGQYDLYVAIDVGGDGYTFSSLHPYDGDLHAAQTNITVNDIVIDQSFTLKAVAGEASLTGSENGDLYVILCTHVDPDGSQYHQVVNYIGISITTATPMTYALDATDLGGGPYYLLGVLTNPGEDWMFSPQYWGWHADRSASAGSESPPVNLDNLQASYNIELKK